MFISSAVKQELVLMGEADTCNILELRVDNLAFMVVRGVRNALVLAYYSMAPRI